MRMLALCFLTLNTAAAFAQEAVEMVTVPRDALGIKFPAVLAQRWGNPDYQPSSASNVLAEITQLPAQVSADLEKLRKISDELSLTAITLPKPDATTRYYRGVNHSQHGLQTNGQNLGEDERIPPATGVWHSEYYYKDNRLDAIVSNDGKGNRWISERSFYTEGKNLARICYNQERGISYVDIGLHKDGKLVLIARFSPELLWYECIFWQRDREEYSARYGVDKVSKVSRLLDLTIEPASLTFDRYGRIERVFRHNNAPAVAASQAEKNASSPKNDAEKEELLKQVKTLRDDLTRMKGEIIIKQQEVFVAGDNLEREHREVLRLREQIKELEKNVKPAVKPPGPPPGEF